MLFVKDAHTEPACSIIRNFSNLEDAVAHFQNMLEGHDAYQGISVNESTSEIVVGWAGGQLRFPYKKDTFLAWREIWDYLGESHPILPKR